jgi:phosphatidylserine/phosphatidylglycerophosphate/cardiolipin synthase-like enzyme
MQLSLILNRACTALLLLGCLGNDAFADSVVEIVQSVPLETTLTVPGIRDTQQVWIEMINSAKHTLDIEQFYIDSKAGQSLEPVLSAIETVAGRGVQVRIIIDSKFYKTYPNDANRLAHIQNIQVGTIDFGSGIQHAKFFILDQNEVFVGSANFDWLALSHIHEVGLHIRDATVANSLESVFLKDWQKAGGVNPLSDQTSHRFVMSPSLASMKLQLVASPASQNPAGVSDSISAITSLLGWAKTSIKIQMYQYSTKSARVLKKWDILDSAIRKAAARGVHVQLLVDAVALKSDKVALQALATTRNIEVRTVTIPEWSGGHLNFARLIHSKYFTADGTAGWVGSENWSENYFTSSRNVGVVFQSLEIASSLERIYNKVWSSPYATSL